MTQAGEGQGEEQLALSTPPLGEAVSLQRGSQQEVAKASPKGAKCAVLSSSCESWKAQKGASLSVKLSVKAVCSKAAEVEAGKVQAVLFKVLAL